VSAKDDEDEDERVVEPPPPKRRRKKKRKGKGSAPTAEASDATGKPAEKPAEKQERVRSGAWIWLALLVVALVELYMFGRRGHIEVCVARQGEHDFALIGTPRTEENTRRYPTCEKRLNVGILSHFDEAKEDAMIHACRRATILRGKRAALECALAAEGWEHRETTAWCPPWHDHYYKRLFWFLD